MESILNLPAETTQEGDNFQILTESGPYTERSYKSEKDLEELVTTRADEVFGKKTLYFGIKQKVASKLHPRVTDGVLIDFRKKPIPHFWVVEYELSSHDLERHVIPQLRGFVKAFGNEETTAAVRESIYQQITASEEKTKRFKELAGGESEIYYTLDKALHGDATILLVYDRVPEDIDEVLSESDFDYDTWLMEFRTFESHGKLVHLVNPLVLKEVDTSVSKGAKRVEGKHLTKNAYEMEILKLLAEQKAPLERKEIIARLGDRLANAFSPADKEMLRSKTRWEKYARFAISDLAIEKSINASTKNQWVITEKGRAVLRELGDLLIKKLNR